MNKLSVVGKTASIPVQNLTVYSCSVAEVITFMGRLLHVFAIPIFLSFDLPKAVALISVQKSAIISRTAEVFC